MTNPGSVLETVRQRVGVQRRASASLDAQSQPLREGLQHCEEAPARVLELRRRGRITLSEADSELSTIAEEAIVLRQQLAHLDERIDHERSLDTQLSRAAVSLAEVAEELEDIDATGDHAARRFVVERLVRHVAVRTLR